MSPFDGFRLTVRLNGQPLTLYDDPEADQSETNDKIRNHYIEAVSGATFSVDLSVRANFNVRPLRDEDAVLGWFSVDGDEHDWCFALNRKGID